MAAESLEKRNLMRYAYDGAVQQTGAVSPFPIPAFAVPIRAAIWWNAAVGILLGTRSDRLLRANESSMARYRRDTGDGLLWRDYNVRIKSFELAPSQKLPPDIAIGDSPGRQCLPE